MSYHPILKDRGKIMLAALILMALACNMPGSSTPAAPTTDTTKAALELQSTLMS